MRQLVRTVVGLSAVALLAALPAAGGAQEPKPAPPAEKKQPAPEKKQTPPAAEKKQAQPAEKKQAPAAAEKKQRHVMFGAADMKWGPAPPGLPAGAEVAVLDGDPGKAGMFTVRIKAPDGYMVRPHSHPTDEHVTVISGNLTMAEGSKWDDSALHDAAAGTYIKMPRRVNHYVRTKGETIFQISATGPFVITYVDPKDDPRKKGTN